MMELSTKAKIRIGATAVLGLLVLVFVVLNGDPVKVDLMVAEVEMSAAFLIIGCVLAGFLLGWSVGSFFRIRARRGG